MLKHLKILGLTMLAFAANTMFSEVKITCFAGDALLRDGSRELYVDLENSGESFDAKVSLAGSERAVKLAKGSNILRFQIPNSKDPQTLPIVVKSEGGEVARLDATVKPVEREWEFYLIQHTHTDIGYTRPQHEILAEHVRFIDLALDYCDSTDDYPDAAKFRWTCEASWAVGEYLKTRPREQIERLKKRVDEGRIEISGMLFNFDEIPDEYSLAQSLQPIKTIRENNLEVLCAMQNDVNGIAWCFADYFGDVGIKYLIMGTHGHKALICFDKPTLFWWQSPSGRKVLAFRAEHYNMGNFLQIHTSNFEVFERKLLEYLEDLKRKGYEYSEVECQYSGSFTDNAKPSLIGPDIIKKWNEKYATPKLRSAVAGDFMSAVEKKYGDKIATIKAAWPDWWTDGAGSASRELAATRAAHAEIGANMSALAAAKLLGAEVPQKAFQEFDEAMSALLFYGEHTFGYYISVTSPFISETLESRRFKESYAWEALRRAKGLGEVAWGLLQDRLPRDKSAYTLSVYNPLSFESESVLTLHAQNSAVSPGRANYFEDESGRRLELQHVLTRNDESYWKVESGKVPALSFKTYKLVNGSDARHAETSNKFEQIFENEYYKICFDESKGAIKSLYDKELDAELLSKGAYPLGAAIYETYPERGVLDKFQKPDFTRILPEKMRFVERLDLPIWTSFKFVGESLAGEGKDNLKVEYRIYKNRKLIEIFYSLNKRQVVSPESLYVSFPFELKDSKIYFDVAGGFVQAGVDQIVGSSNDWNTVQNFASVRSSAGQIILASPEAPLMQFGNINTGRFRAGAKPDSSNIFSWVLNNYWITNFNAEQQGELRWTYYVGSCKNSSLEYACNWSRGLRTPMLSRLMPPRGKVSAGESLSALLNSEGEFSSGRILEISPSNLSLISMAPCRGENAVILQVRELANKAAKLEIKSEYFGKNAKLQTCNAIGEILNEDLNFAPLESKFVKLTLTN